MLHLEQRRKKTDGRETNGYHNIQIMKIAITWASWFIGSHLVRYFSTNNEIVALSRKGLDLNKENIQSIAWDLNKPVNFDLWNIDVFIHCAADIGYTKDKSVMIKNNSDSIKNVINLITWKVKHFIYVSSSSVYQWLEWILSESCEINPDNLKNSYSLSKYLAEREILKNIPEDIKLSILRPRAVYWDWDKALLPNILKYSFWKKLFMIWDWNVFTSVTDIKNFCKATELVINCQQSNKEIFNVADIRPITIKEVYEKVKEVFWFTSIISLNENLLKCFQWLNENKISYILDNFSSDKVLDLEKIQRLWYAETNNLIKHLDSLKTTF